jgi:3-phenylpropionate/cinnamic acid dioxygenase small subunit
MTISSASETYLRNAPIEPAKELLLARQVERFVARELELLDSREFEAWAALFTDDGIYWAPSRVDQTDPKNELSLLYDDKAIREMRFLRLRHPRVHAQVPHSRTTHVVGNFVIDDLDEAAGSVAFHCSFISHEYRPEFEQRSFAGRYDYRLVEFDAAPRIRFKKATIINCDAMHFPISIPI